MAAPNFIDYVALYVRAGKGGAGAIHFRREKCVPKGGPDGGDGGRGGHILVRGNQHLATLLHLHYCKHILAEDGKPGTGACCTGATGADKILEVPLGTVIKVAETEQVLLEITQDGQTCILMEGGIGGWGNTHFKSATQQTPRYAQPGKVGQEAWIVLEIKLLADVGLIGLPNAGKSTLLSVLSAAKPTIADYPFTTLTPQLGVVACRETTSFVMADIPGLIEGAAQGKGLGTRFLRHIERNALLLFLIAADTPDPLQAYRLLVKELKEHNPTLLDKPQLVAISKIDLVDATTQAAIVQRFPIPPIRISSVTEQGLVALKDTIQQRLQAHRKGAPRTCC